MPNSSHRTRRPTLFGSALLATVAPLLMLGALATLIVGWFVGDHLTDTIALSAHAEADRQTDRLGRYLEARQRLLEVLARSPVLRSGDVEASLAYLASEAKALDGLYEGLYLNQLDGTVRGATGVTFSVVDRAYWPRVLRGEVVKSELITSRATGRRVALFVVPIQQDGRLIAALGGTALLESTLVDIADSAALLGGIGGVVDQDGQVLSGHPVVGELARSNTATHESGAHVVDLGGTTWHAWFTSVPSTGWRHILAWQEDQLFAPMSTLRYVLIGLVTLAVGGALIAAWALRRGVARPLEEVTRALERFAQEPTTRAPTGGPDELARLAETFNTTADRLHSETAERKRLEAELAHAARLESVGRLAGGVAHDFNNLLTVILTLAELVRDQVEDEQLKNDLDAVSEAAQQAAALTSQLLAFARRSNRSVEVVVLDETLTGFAPMLRRLLPEHIALDLVLGAGDARVELDPTELLQVVMNLCTNARDAMPAGGHITLATALEAASDSPGKLRLSVSDQGEGIAQEILPHIFEPFFSTKGVGRGTGLGLATCFGIVTRAGGNIAVESFEGGGTTFTLHLPRSFKAAALRPRDGGRTPVRRRVMLVEDAPLVRETTRLLLERAGHTVTAFDCARAAREAQLGTFDVLLTDLRMPGESGASFASYALTQHPDLKVVLMSGYFDAEDLTALSADPRVSLIPKPLQSATLLDLIGRA